MACEICEHCHEPLMRHSNSIVREGCSYHEKCYKCYVCSETNLHNAEVFKGVIFCSACSKRIFRGCSSARRSKDSTRNKSLKCRSRPKRRDRFNAKSIYHEQYEYKPLGVIEQARKALSFDSYTDELKRKVSLKYTARSEMSRIDASIYDEIGLRRMNKNSVEMGVTTDITQQLLKEINCPVVEYENKKLDTKQSLTQIQQIDKSRNKHKLSDLRMAEIGASTEITAMTLRKQSDLPITMQSHYRVDPIDSVNLSSHSERTADCLEEWLESTERSNKLRLIDRSLRSLLKIPYKYFKRNILLRSSMISILMSSENIDLTIFNRIKDFFYEEIVNHHRRGERKLYSIINRNRIPYKLGWLHVPRRRKSKVNVCCRRIRCKHFRNSHSYRCLRAHVMKRAGPTKSELALFRANLIKKLTPDFLRYFFIQNWKPDTMSKACGNSDISKNGSNNFALLLH